MAIFATFDAVGLPLGFYPADVFPDVVPLAVNPAIPSGAVAITVDQWQDFLAHPGARRWDGTAVVAYAASPVPVDLNAYAAAAHLARRDGGVVIAGMTVKTDGESRGLITGAYSLSEVRPDAKIDFKAASGWISLDAATMQTIAVAVGLWVQACYSTYRAVSAGIAAGTTTTPAQIDAAFAAVTLPS